MKLSEELKKEADYQSENENHGCASRLDGLVEKAKLLEEGIPTINKMNLDEQDVLVFRYKYPVTKAQVENIKKTIVVSNIKNRVLFFEGELEIDILAKEKIIYEEVK